MLDAGIVASLLDLAAMSDDGAAQLLQLVELFSRDAATRLGALAAAAASDDDRAVMTLAHSLAGSAANLGARTFADACRDIEHGIESGSCRADAVDVAALQDALACAVAALRQLFGDAAPG